MADRRTILKWLGLGFISKALFPPDASRGGWYNLVRESFPGAWQHNIEINFDSVLSHHAVYSCVTLIASDIAKLRVKLVAQDGDDVWTETNNSAFSPVLRKPNRYQTRNQFWESYMLSKLLRGNTYVLKQRDNRGVVIALYVLDPCRTKPLIAPDGAVFYQLSADDISGIEEQVIVPASEIIHDRFNCLFHPLCGMSPIFANGLSATQGLSIQKNATRFFENQAMPGGLLIAPGPIDQKDVDRVKAGWENGYGGSNAGRIAFLSNGMRFERLTMTSVESQMVEQLRWSAEIICSTFHVPKYKIGIGDFPPYGNIQAANVEYYQECLQSLIEAAEECLDEGLGIGWRVGIGTEFDVDNLLRMDSVTQMDVLEKAKSVMTLDERRKKLELKHVTGGNTIYLQQQDHSIEAIAARDAMLIEQANNPPAANDNMLEQQAAAALIEIRKGFA